MRFVVYLVLLVALSGKWPYLDLSQHCLIAGYKVVQIESQQNNKQEDDGEEVESTTKQHVPSSKEYYFIHRGHARLIMDVGTCEALGYSTDASTCEHRSDSSSHDSNSSEGMDYSHHEELLSWRTAHPAAEYQSALVHHRLCIPTMDSSLIGTGTHSQYKIGVPFPSISVAVQSPDDVIASDQLDTCT